MAQADTASELHPKARTILRELAQERTAATADLTDTLPFKGDLIRYHMDALIERGFAEQTGTRETGFGHPTNVYRVTGQGRTAAETITSDDVPDAEVKRLVARVEELESEVEDARGDVKALEQRFEAHRETADDIFTKLMDEVGL